MSPDGVMISDDLIFISRVTATARAKGKTVQAVKTVAEAATQSVPVYIVDLNYLRGELPDLISLRPGARIIGYGSHVDSDTLKAARKAGCHDVMPRSQFAERLESHLETWLTPRVAESEP